MTIIFKDGSTLECNTIELYGDYLFCDDYRTVNTIDVEKIVEG